MKSPAKEAAMASKTPTTRRGAGSWLSLAASWPRAFFANRPQAISAEDCDKILQALFDGGAEGARALQALARRKPDIFRGFFPLAKKRRTAQGAPDLYSLRIAFERQTPLMAALTLQQQECAEVLIPLSDLLAQDPAGKTALLLAVTRAPARLTATLLDGSDVNARTAEGTTALMLAAYHGLFQTVALLARCPRVNADEFGLRGHANEKTALDLAMEVGERKSIPPLASASSHATRARAFGLALRHMRDVKQPFSGRFSNRWACLDALSASVPDEMARAAFALAALAPAGPAHLMPIFSATVEAAVLKAEILQASPDAPSGSPEPRSQTADAAQPKIRSRVRL